MTSTYETKLSSKLPITNLVPLSTDDFTQPFPHISSTSSISTTTSAGTTTSTSTSTTMSASNSDSAFNISIQSPGGTPCTATFPELNTATLTCSTSTTSLQKKVVAFRDSSEEEDDEDEEEEEHEEDQEVIDIVLAHKKDIDRLKVLKNKIAQSPVYFTRYLVETYPHMIQHNQQDENPLPNARNIWKNQQLGFLSELGGTTFNETKAKQLFLSRSYKPSSSSNTIGNNLNYCKQYYFYSIYENYILPEVLHHHDENNVEEKQSKNRVGQKDQILLPPNKHQNSGNVLSDNIPTREKNMDTQSVTIPNVAVTTSNKAENCSEDCAMMENSDDNRNIKSLVSVREGTPTTTPSAPQNCIKEDDSNDIKLEVQQQKTNQTENNQQTSTVAATEKYSEYHHRRVLSDSATLWNVNDASTLASDESQEFKTPTKKVELTNRFGSTDDFSSVPSTVERDTDLVGSNREGDIRFMIDSSASPFIPLSPLVAFNASPSLVPITPGAFQEMNLNQSPRLIRSGSVVGLDKKTPNNLQSPKKKAHRRVKSFNLTHAPGELGSEFDIKCVKVELVMLDIDTYMTKFEPIRIMSDRWVGDLDFIKFGVKIFNRIYLWLEDSLVHQFSIDKIDLSECPTIDFNLSEQPLSKVLDTTCQIINEYNTKQKYSYYNYHSFSFARRVIEKLSGKKLKSKNALPKTLVKYFRDFRDVEKKKREKEEKEEKEQAKASSSASPISPNDVGKDGDEFDIDATPTCKENLPLTPVDYLDLLIEEEKNRDTNFIYYVPKKLILKKYRKFHQKQEIKNHTYLLNLINSLLEQCPKFKEEYKFDYLILKTLDRKFWLEKYLQENYDPVKQKCKFFHKEGIKLHFEEPTYLRDLLKERIDRRRKIFNVKIEVDQTVEESPFWKNTNDNIITNFSKYREEKKGKTVKVLSLDGGGMKGLILIEILKVIEERVGKKVCEIFDVVGGTSTGGIVALLINGGIPMKLAKDIYIDIGRNIFDLKTTRNKSLVKTMKVLRGRSWYDGYHLEMTSMKHTQDIDLNTLHKRTPFTFLVSTMDKSSNPKMNLEEPTAFVFRTYSDPYDYVEEGETSSSSSKKQPSFYRGTATGIGITAMDVIRATSAAPMYFKPRTIGDSEFIDGAVVANNPIQLSMYEAKQIFPNHDKFVFLSLGTGAVSGKNNEENGDEEVNFNGSPQGNNKPRKKSIMKAFKGISQTLNTLLSVVNLQLSSDRIHKMATAQLEFFKEGKSLCEYFRLNVPGLGDKGLDEVDDELFALFEKETVAYMENHPDLDRLCQLLSQE